MLQMLPKMVGTKELLGRVTCPEVVDGLKMFQPLVPVFIGGYVKARLIARPMDA